MTIYGKGGKTRRVLLSVPIWREMEAFRDESGFAPPWVSWVATTTGGSCILNGLIYRLASNKTKDAALHDETLFLDFLNAGWLSVVTTDGSEILAG